MARRSVVPSGCFGCGSLTKPVLPVKDHIAGLACRLSTLCDCLACGLLGGCFRARDWAYSILSFWSRENASRLSSVTRELCSARASSLMTSRVPGCASPNIFVRTASVRRVSATPCFFGSPVAPTALASPRTSIAGDSGAVGLSHGRVLRSLTQSDLTQSAPSARSAEDARERARRGGTSSGRRRPVGSSQTAATAIATWAQSAQQPPAPAPSPSPSPSPAPAPSG